MLEYKTTHLQTNIGDTKWTHSCVKFVNRDIVEGIGPSIDVPWQSLQSNMI